MRRAWVTLPTFLWLQLLSDIYFWLHVVGQGQPVTSGLIWAVWKDGEAAELLRM